MNNPLVTVYTPTWNRATTLHRVWESLVSQSYRNFEWLVCDDGSTDETIELLLKWKSIATFPIKIVSFATRVGKPRVDNTGIQLASGEFWICVDSDDGLTSDAIAIFVRSWYEIPSNRVGHVCAILARCLWPSGLETSPPFDCASSEMSALDLWYKFKRREEQCLFIKLSALQNYQWPEVDYFIPESIVWHELFDRFNVFVINDCLRVLYPNTFNSLTYNKKMSYMVGAAHWAVATINFFAARKKLSGNVMLKHIINYQRYYINSGSSLNNLFENISDPGYRMLAKAVFPVALLLSLRDRFLNKLELHPYDTSSIKNTKYKFM